MTNPPTVGRALRKVRAGVRAFRDDVRRELPASSRRRPGESQAEVRERSKSRWRQARPTDGLTWGRTVTGDAFIERVESYAAFSPETRVLEIGPGYGRLLRACLGRGTPFQSYTMVDLSEDNITYLRGEFPDPRVAAVVGDIEGVHSTNASTSSFPRLPSSTSTRLSPLPLEIALPTLRRKD